MLVRTGSFALLAVILGIAPWDAANSQETGIEYAAKIICGVPDRPALAPGVYFTAINIHNPGNDSVRFRQKFAITRAGEAPGPISPFSGAMLGPDQALEIDCTDIARRSRERGFIKGFAVIQSPTDLDIVAVYTAAPSIRQPVVALEVERVPGRRHDSRGCTLPDLIVESIGQPTFLQATGSTRIEAVIRNIGSGAAGPSLARAIDPSTFISPGVPQNSVANTPALAAGASATVVFSLPYWIFNPDAALDVTADYKNDVAECNERNNTKSFQAVG